MRTTRTRTRARASAQRHALMHGMSHGTGCGEAVGPLPGRDQRLLPGVQQRMMHGPVVQDLARDVAQDLARVAPTRVRRQRLHLGAIPSAGAPARLTPALPHAGPLQVGRCCHAQRRTLLFFCLAAAPPTRGLSGVLCDRCQAPFGAVACSRAVASGGLNTQIT